MNNDLMAGVIELTKSNNVIIQNLANSTISLYYKHKNNEISDDEFDELMKDVISVADIQNGMNDIEMYRLAKKTINTLLTIKSIVSLL